MVFTRDLLHIFFFFIQRDEENYTRKLRRYTCDPCCCFFVGSLLFVFWQYLRPSFLNERCNVSALQSITEIFLDLILPFWNNWLMWFNQVGVKGLITTQHATSYLIGYNTRCNSYDQIPIFTYRQTLTTDGLYYWSFYSVILCRQGFITHVHLVWPSWYRL